MKRSIAALAATTLFLVVAALVALRPGDASSQTATGHEGHAQPAPGAKPADTGSKAETPTPVGDGKMVALPGVPPGKPAYGGGVTTTIVAEVMDPACFLEAGSKSIGKGHFQCAVDCAKSGQTLALYDRALDRIYFVAGELPGRNPNDPLMPYIHQKVDVVGTVYHRSQAWGIVIIKVSPHKEKPASAAQPAAPKAGGR
ncbi:MAG TPA: hypothetical protein VFU59_00410 [Candidatus Eisenbacteria bacterium]|nr:hypothetical protein [Candidatus Eisenbacteria bacterium]